MGKARERRVEELKAAAATLKERVEGKIGKRVKRAGKGLKKARKSLPKKKHDAYVRLVEPDRQLVSWLGGILRLADGLDRRRSGVVTDVRDFLEEAFKKRPLLVAEQPWI